MIMTNLSSIPIPVLIVLLGLSGSGNAVDINVTGDWNTLAGADDLIGGAGTDMRPETTSAGGACSLDVSNTDTESWTVRVSRDNDDWPSGVTLSVRRTGDGSGPGSVWGGTSYVTVDGSERTLFSGLGDRSNVQLQLRLQGRSIDQSPDVYASTLTYSVQ